MHSNFFRLRQKILLFMCIVAARYGSMENQGSDSKTDAELFSSPTEAIQALINAVQYSDKESLRAIFGPDLDRLLTGDEVQDSANFRSFAKAVSEKCIPIDQNANRRTLEI